MVYQLVPLQRKTIGHPFVLLKKYCVASKVPCGISVGATSEEEHWPSFCVVEEVLRGKKVGDDHLL